MKFFDEWKMNISDEKFIKTFLTEDEIYLELINSEDSEYLKNAFSVLNELKMGAVVDVIVQMQIEPEVTPDEVPQFSTFSHGAQRVSELLEFEPDGMDFVKLGKQLVSSPNDAACRKYGENHAKLAKLLGLVSITKTRPVVVASSQWGKYLLKYSENEKHAVLAKMICREHLIKKLIQNSYEGEVDYFEMVDLLAKSTAIRRRTNVKELMEFVLEGSEYEGLLRRINWYGR